MSLQSLLDETQQLRQELYEHSIYSSFTTLHNVKHFMQYHVFAVWDFMSLVKSLQGHFCGTQTPWTPPKNAQVARFINEIVLGEESDVMPSGQTISHFEMYLMAMKEIGADTSAILTFLDAVYQEPEDMSKLLKQVPLDPAIVDFLRFTFGTIASGKMHCIAASFAFGREDIIPNMFMKVVSRLDQSTHIPAFRYYLERHIELDGYEHGPIAMEMVKAICGDEQEKWQEATDAVKDSLQARINLWTSIELRNPKLLSNAY